MYEKMRQKTLKGLTVVFFTSVIRGFEHSSLTKNPKNESKGYLGVFIMPSKIDYKEGFFVRPFFWIRSAIYWIFFANLFVGLFNLLPLGIVDGGRMFYLTVLHFTKNEKKSKNK